MRNGRRNQGFASWMPGSPPLCREKRLQFIDFGPGGGKAVGYFPVSQTRARLTRLHFRETPNQIAEALLDPDGPGDYNVLADPL